jgi:DNA-binding CsgD family transcriptional regulator
MNNQVKKIFSAIGSRRGGGGKRVFELEEQTHMDIVRLAETENLDVNALPSMLINSALENRKKDEALWQRWLTLSYREQQVVALTCLGMTNRQIGARLMVSTETVKTHCRNAAVKLGLRGKGEMRRTFSDWDFTQWA